MQHYINAWKPKPGKEKPVCLTCKKTIENPTHRNQGTHEGECRRLREKFRDQRNHERACICELNGNRPHQSEQPTEADTEAHGGETTDALGDVARISQDVRHLDGQQVDGCRADAAHGPQHRADDGALHDSPLRERAGEAEQPAKASVVFSALESEQLIADLMIGLEEV